MINGLAWMMVGWFLFGYVKMSQRDYKRAIALPLASKPGVMTLTVIMYIVLTIAEAWAFNHLFQLR